MEIENNAVSAVTAEPMEKTVSLMDRIDAATVDNYREVLQEIVKTADSVKMEIQVAKLAKVLGVNKTTMLKEMKSTTDASLSGDEIFEPEMKAVFPGLVDVVRDESGKVRYLLKEDGGVRLADTWQDKEGITFRPPEEKYIKFLLPNAERAMSLYSDNDDTKLYEDLKGFFKRFSYLEEDVWPIIVLSVFLSYIQDHVDVRYIPVIYFYAVAERGKSKTAKTILATSYRGLPLSDIRPANIFRFATNWKATLFFDVTDLWKSAEKGDGQDILLGRFEKGSSVARVLNPEKGAFADQTFFEIYGSTIVTTNEPANVTFESRCLSITMPNKPGDYENLTPEMALPFKDRLTAWRARMMDRHFTHLDAIPGITGRLWEISKPLFQLAQMISPDAYEQMKRVILEMAGQKIEDKKETVEGQLVAAIDSLAEFDGKLPTEIPVEDIRTKLNFGKPIQFQISPQKLGKRIQSLSIKTKAVNGYSRAVITAPQLQVLKIQYGLIEPEVSGETLPLPTTRQEEVPTATHTGRESGESKEPANNSLGLKTTELQEVEREVESGSELSGISAHGDDEQHQAYLNLINGTEEPKATEPSSTDQPTERKKTVIDFGPLLAQKAAQDKKKLEEESLKRKIQFGPR